MASPTFFSDGNTPNRLDTQWRISQKILGILVDGGGGLGGSGAVLQDATGAPPADPTHPAISFPTGGGGISEWDVASQTWI